MELKDLFGPGIETLVGALAGWLGASVTKASRKEVAILTVELDTRLKALEQENRQFVTKLELREELKELRFEIKNQYDLIRADLARIQTTLMERRPL